MLFVLGAAIVASLSVYAFDSTAGILAFLGIGLGALLAGFGLAVILASLAAA
jgi:hypothetical protein